MPTATSLSAQVSMSSASVHRVVYPTATAGRGDVTCSSSSRRPRSPGASITVHVVTRACHGSSEVPGSWHVHTRAERDTPARRAAMNLYAKLLTTSLRHASRTNRVNSLPRGLFSLASPKPVVWRRPIATPSRTFTASLTEQSRPPSLVKFLSSKFLQATHRSRTVSSSRSRNPFTPPPNPQGPWQRFIRWIESIPSKVIFWGVLVINGAVFGSWQLATALYVRTLCFHDKIKLTASSKVAEAGTCTSS